MNCLGTFNRSAAAAAALLLAVSSPSAAAPGASGINEFTGESVPSDASRLQLQWEFGGETPEGMVFRLERVVSDTLAALVATLESSARNYETALEPGVAAPTYRLTAQIGDSVVSSAATGARIARTGDFVAAQAHDTPYDGGGQIDVRWTLNPPSEQPLRIKIYRSLPEAGEWTLAGGADSSSSSFTDSGLEDGTPYRYLVRIFTADAIYDSPPVAEATSHPAWFDMRKINLLVISVIVLTAVIWLVLTAGKREMYIRRIAGLQAVEEAVGRATEMGRSVLFIPGISDLDDVQTIAGLTILGSVAKMTAQYETRLDVPVARSLVMSNGREVVKESYLSVGRPDFYNDEIVHYVTDEQFGYVAAVDGIMVREKPATCFYMGAFFAESLILAETGNHVGAIQIAGTAMPTQLPFFVAACDYTLIGEELFAASAYLSKDQRAIASLRGQDIGKGLAMVSMVVGVLLTTAASIAGGGFWGRLSDAFLRLFALNF